MNFSELESYKLADLRKLARDWKITAAERMKKEDLIIKIVQVNAEREGLALRGGVLEITDDNMGFLRSDHYQVGPDNIYVSQSQIRRFGLRTGDMVIGQVRAPKESEKYYGLLRVDSINGMDPEAAKRRPIFEQQTPIFPETRFDLETDRMTLATRLLNLITPIGKGQRGLIVSPPKAGKTTVLKQIANAISLKYPDVHLMVALIGERPEEVTDMDRSVDAEVIASTFDDPVTSHVRVAEIALERAKRLVEGGRDVVILLDSITRLARAYNLVVTPSGRTLSGGGKSGRLAATGQQAQRAKSIRAAGNGPDALERTKNTGQTRRGASAQNGRAD